LPQLISDSFDTLIESPSPEGLSLLELLLLREAVQRAANGPPFSPGAIASGS
jgi:hypothetical protein